MATQIHGAEMMNAIELMHFSVREIKFRKSTLRSHGLWILYLIWMYNIKDLFQPTFFQHNY